MTGVQTCALPICFPVTIQQTSFTKTESFYPIRVTAHTNTTTAGANLFGNIYWDNDEWSVASKNVYHETTLKVSATNKTANVDLNDGSTDLDTRSTSSTSKVLLTSANLSIVDNTCI